MDGDFNRKIKRKGEYMLRNFTINVLDIIMKIPAGRVMTYGQIAGLAGNGRGARQVSWILHSMSEKHQLPWHRVVNSKGKISLTGSEQRELLELEGVEFNRTGAINLEKYQWHG
jgi:methylated-DNA-protein-cysteine methyltransferase-like protein